MGESPVSVHAGAVAGSEREPQLRPSDVELGSVFVRRRRERLLDLRLARSSSRPPSWTCSTTRAPSSRTQTRTWPSSGVRSSARSSGVRTRKPSAEGSIASTVACPAGSSTVTFTRARRLACAEHPERIPQHLGEREHHRRAGGGARNRANSPSIAFTRAICSRIAWRFFACDGGNLAAGGPGELLLEDLHVDRQGVQRVAHVVDEAVHEPDGGGPADRADQRRDAGVGRGSEQRDVRWGPRGREVGDPRGARQRAARNFCRSGDTSVVPDAHALLAEGRLRPGSIRHTRRAVRRGVGVLCSAGVSRLTSSSFSWAGDLEDARVPVELSVHDADTPGVGHQLEARPAGAGGGVERRAVDADAVLRRLENGVGLGVHRRHAVAVLHHVPHLVAVGHPADAAVVAGGEDGAVAHQHRSHVLAVAGRAGGDLPGDVHEVLVPRAPGHGAGLNHPAPTSASPVALADQEEDGLLGADIAVAVPLAHRGERLAHLLQLPGAEACPARRRAP